MWVEFEDNSKRIPEGIMHLQKQNDLYMYGNGNYAEDIFERLQRWYVHIKGVIVSDEYFQPGSEFHGLKVLPFSEVRRKVNIVAGYNILIYEDLNKALINSEIVDRIYYLEGTRAFMHNMNLQKDIILVDDYYKILLNRKFDYTYFQENLDAFTQTYDWLADEKSRMTMKCYLKGHIEVKSWPMLSVWNEIDAEQQYFPNDIILLSQHEVFIDCGAFTGDTLETFNKHVDAFDKYYALEPDAARFEQLSNVIKAVSNKGDIVHLPIGVSDKNVKAYFDHSSAGCGQVVYDKVSTGELGYVELNSIDNILDKEEKVTFIKMDIEGEEMPALKGARNVIQKHKPKLAICVYHKREDLISIPQYLKKLVPEYKLYLRAHWPNASEVVLYGICE